MVIDSRQTTPENERGPEREHSIDVQCDSSSLAGQIKFPQRRGLSNTMFRRSKSSDSCLTEELVVLILLCVQD